MVEKNVLLNNNGKAKGFTIVSNKLLSASNASLKAKALYAYLSSKPDRWSFSSLRIANEILEGKDAIQATLIELEQLNLLRRRKMKDDNGNWNGVVYYLIDIDDSNLVNEYFNNKKDDVAKGKTIEKREDEFKDRCRPVYQLKKERMTASMIQEFIKYWTEKTYGGKKMRFEMQTAFDISRRMETWIRNSQSYKANSGYKSTTQLKKELQIQNT